MATAGRAALEASGLSKSFRAVRALDDVTIDLHYGRVTALLGDNGAGKSTLVKCISGIYAPDSGVIRVNGVEQAVPSRSCPVAGHRGPSTRPSR